MEDLIKLQNGTDIRGVALENEQFNVNLHDDNIRAIAKGIVQWLDPSQKNLKIAIGRDSRITGEKIKNILAEEFLAKNIEVMDAGIATTPAMFMTTIWEKYNCDCGIMITASHLPYFYNGMKLFTKNGAVEKSDIIQILSNAQNSYNEKIETPKNEAIKQIDLIEDYSNYLVNLIKEKTKKEFPFTNMKIIVDAGNGAGGFFASKVLEKLGADTSGSQFLEPDGMFPNHQPNPENKEAMKSISNAVIKNKADLGIIFDTDVDRAGIVTDDGQEINRNTLIALLSHIILREHPKSVIVTDSITSDGLTKFIESLGGVHHRFKRGYKNVINEAKRINKEETNNSYLAIETSGHGAMEENYFLDDGTYLVAKLLIEASNIREKGEKLQDIIKNLEKPFESKELRIKILEENFKEYGTIVLDNLKIFAKNENWEIVNPNYEGVKVRFEGGWILSRMSLHEPLIATNIETNQAGIMENILEKFNNFLKEQDGLKF